MLRAGLASCVLGLLPQHGLSDDRSSEPAPYIDQQSVCLDSAVRIEREYRIPHGLLYALALTESGRWDSRSASSYAWPWTIRSGADAIIADDMASAVEAVESLRAEGRRNIDIGCMQVNLMYHPDAFPTLVAAFDPDANVRYAAGFLRQLRDQHQSWARAIERYHSGDRERALAYRKRVYKHWNKVRRDPSVRRSASLERPRLIRPARDPGGRLHLLGRQTRSDGPDLLKQ